jgi:hypothetical protein
MLREGLIVISRRFFLVPFTYRLGLPLHWLPSLLERLGQAGASVVRRAPLELCARR